MKPWWQRWRWTVLLGALVALGFSALQLHGRAWALWGVEPMQPPYVDLVALLSAGEANARGIDVYHRNPLDPYGRPHVYGPTWLLTGKLGLVTEDAWWLGTLLAAAFIAAASVLLAPATGRALVWGVLALLAPPFVLGLERGNNDLVVFLLLLWAAGAVALRSRVGGFAATAAVVIAAALKFYPLAALAGLAARTTGPWRRVGWISAGVVAFALIWLWQRQDIARALALAPQPKTIFAYGLPVMRFTWTFLPDERLWLAFGTIATLPAALVWLFRVRRALLAALPLAGWRTAAFLGCSAAWIACFVLVPSYPYRIALLLPAAAVWWRAENPRAIRGFSWLLVGACWLSTPKHWLACVTEQFPDQRWAWHAVAGVAAAEQAAILALTVAVALTAAGWALRRAQPAAHGPTASAR